MTKTEIDLFYREAENMSHQLSISKLIEFAKNLNAEIKQNPTFVKGLKNLCKHYKFHYT
jgi:hypothetical protein